MKTRRVIMGWLLLSSMTITLSAQDAAKYEIESAIIKKEITMMGQKLNAIWYIDEFGRKESVEITIKNGIAQGVDKHIRTLMEGTSVVTVDLDMKVGNRMELPEKPVNYLQLTPEITEKYNIQENGEEEIAGKKCRKYSLELSQMGQTMQVKAWVWKGLVLKSETSAGSMAVVVETATEIEENASVSDDKFITPAGAVIK
ncbi:MAG: hypothetical protein LBG28_03460 [Tannerella sp.]|jgi:hypothetical protein|nr:hypothetical protein [Tannerella sp.]